MKVIISGDHHYDWSTLGVPRFDEVARAVEHVTGTAIRECAGLYIFTGDLSETEGPGMLRGLEHSIAQASRLHTYHVQSLWLPGNHDVIEDGLCTSTLNPMRDVPGATLADRPCVIKFGQAEGFGPKVPGKKLIHVCCLPFTPRSHDYDPAAFVREHAHEPVDLVVGHLMLEGIGPGSETRDMPRGRNVFWPLEEIERAWPNALKVGAHYHRKQVYRGVHLPGSLVRLTKAEASNEPSFIRAVL